MTNVKLKLMFFVLNALLTADFVHARPYSDLNITEFVKSYSNQNYTEDFHLPVDRDADTLIVAEDPIETQEESNRSSKTSLDAIVNGEQDRDEDLSKKFMKEQGGVLDLAQGDAEGFHKQFNISSAVLEGIFDAETGREEALAGILFRPEIEYNEDMPKFEFLISAKINESDIVKRNNISDNGSGNYTDGTRKIEYVELVELDKPTKIGENKSAYSLGNITGHEVENDVAPDTSKYL